MSSNFDKDIKNNLAKKKSDSSSNQDALPDSKSKCNLNS